MAEKQLQDCSFWLTQWKTGNVDWQRTRVEPLLKVADRGSM